MREMFVTALLLTIHKIRYYKVYNLKITYFI